MKYPEEIARQAAEMADHEAEIISISKAFDVLVRFDDQNDIAQVMEFIGKNSTPVTVVQAGKCILFGLPLSGKAFNALANTVAKIFNIDDVEATPNELNITCHSKGVRQAIIDWFGPAYTVLESPEGLIIPRS